MKFAPIVAIPTQAEATINGIAIPTQNMLYCSAQAVATGASVAGTLKLQASNDNPVAGLTPTNWNDIPSATVSVTGPGPFMIPITELCYEWIRAVFTDSGSGGKIGATVKIIGF